MNATDPRFPQNPPIDPDLAEQARPGHGVPSQDPEPQAQQPLPPEDQERESKSVLMGGGAMAGAAAGAAVGAATAGPVGVFVGTLAGSVAGCWAALRRAGWWTPTPRHRKPTPRLGRTASARSCAGICPESGPSDRNRTCI